jgi:arsenate reductase
MDKVSVLVICTGNSRRSQMAEGLIRAELGDKAEVYSAGVSPADRVHPYAVEVMKELGIDISGHRPKSLEQFMDKDIDVVITVCDNAKKTCPVFPGAPVVLHWELADPGVAPGCAAEVKESFRETAHIIRKKMNELEKVIDETGKKKNG